MIVINYFVEIIVFFGISLHNLSCKLLPSNLKDYFLFFQYKYQISIDGTVAAYRFPYLLAGSGVILKQDSGYYEHFYKELEPYIHYIPFKSDLSDLIEKVRNNQ